MAAAAIAPRDAITVDPVYELFSPHQLPVLDGRKCVKHVLLSRGLLHLFNRTTRFFRRWLVVAYSLGIAATLASMFAPRHYRPFLAIVSVPLQLLPSSVAFLVLRFDMVRLLLRTYEFWYYSLSTAVVGGLLTSTLADVRGLAVLTVCVTNPLTLLMDANFRATHAAVASTLVGALVALAYNIGIALSIIPDLRAVTVLRYKTHALSANDSITNLLSTMFLLGLRNAYRKHQHANDENGRVVCCSYRCRLALRQVHPAGSDEGVDGAVVRVASRVKLQGYVHLEAVRDSQQFGSRDVVLRPRLKRLLPQRMSRVLNSLIVTSLVAIPTTFAVTDATTQQAAAVISITSASVVVAAYIALANRQLLTRLFSSFDFVFVSVQVTIAHSCLVSIVGWDSARAIALAASWLLFHWVLTLDAVVPVFKTHRLGFHKPLAAAVLVLFVSLQQFVALALVVADTEEATDPRMRLMDHRIYRFHLNGATHELRVVPLLFQRVATTLSWSARLLWRLRRSDPSAGDLLMLQGQVSYDNRAATFSHTLSAATIHPAEG